ncbi:MAG: putative sugar nucleotidyl transferase [Gemmatimonadota bacterium]|nr:putative sugar nucleotidyl transferase [Gemmatimonadota bacterium]
MNPPDVFVFDDRVADGFDPFSLTRPCGEILYGRWCVRERVARATGTIVAGHVTRPWLAAYVEAGAPPVVRPGSIDAGKARLFWSSRAVPTTDLPTGGEANIRIDGMLAGVVLGPGAETPERDWFDSPEPVDRALNVDVDGEWLDAPWDLVAGAPGRLRADLETLGDRLGDHRDRLPDYVHVLGDAPVALGDGATLEPGVLIDTRGGPVELGPAVEVRAGTRLEGPVFADHHSRLLGGAISTLAAGPFSYLRGELEEVTAFGYCNKAHDGFIGHAVIGRWVNLGAMTTNSDLKNNYGTVRMGPPEAAVDTGLVKLGCLLGDHVKTGIGALLNTGTTIGAGSNVYGSAMPPKWVPPFSWGEGEELTEYRCDAFVETAMKVMARRGVEVDERMRTGLEAVWGEARG